MCKILIFGGTTEGRELAEFCAENGIPADVSVVSQTGADLIEVREGLHVHVGPLDGMQMQVMMKTDVYRLVIDATHPYAKEATQNIKTACEITQTPYLRVKRESVPITGPAFDTLDEMIVFINEAIEANETDPENTGPSDTSPVRILSSLGGKSLPQLTAIRDFGERVWVRVLPSEEILRQAVSLGYPAAHVIMEKGPFSVSQNMAHLQKSGASFLLTKESGKTGGYPEKAAAAAQCGVTLLTLRRAAEEGVTVAEAKERIVQISSD